MDTSQTRLAYIPEVTYGVTPATPAFNVMRYTGESLVPNVQYVTSNEINTHRQVSDLTQVGGEAGGDINIELSYGNFDTLLEALLGGTWASNVLKVGNAERSFTIEKKFEGGATDYFERYIGSRIGSLSLNLAAKEIVTGSFGIMSKQAVPDDDIITGATYVAPNTNPVMNASTGFQSLSMSGITQPELMRLSLNITNNLRQQPVMGSIGSKGVGLGQFAVTGEFDAYFVDHAILAAYLNNVATDLSFVIGGVGALNYTLALGNMKFSAVGTPTPGNNQDVMQTVGFSAIYDASDVSSIVLTRDPS